MNESPSDLPDKIGGIKKKETYNLSRKKIKRPLGRDEEFVDYKYVTENGITKRKKVIKKTLKKIKMLTEE
jgi:hypothetical protein